MNDQQKQVFAAVAFFGVVAIGGAIYGHLVFARSSINGYKTRAAEQDKQITELKKKLSEIRGWMAQKDEMNKRRAEIAKVIKRLPSSTDAPGFLSALLQVLRSTGIIQERVKSENPEARSQYTEIPYSIVAYGRFHELGQFLTLIEQNPDRFMKVKSLLISNNMERPSVHPIKMQLKTFTFAGSALATTP